MRKPDLVPLVAWIIWEMFFEEPESTDRHGKDEDSETQDPPPDVGGAGSA